MQFIKYNGYDLNMLTKAPIEFVVDIVNHRYSFKEMVEIIKEYTTLRG